MKLTRAFVEGWAKKKGLELLQEDGIPEGFIWKEPDLQIGEQFIKGRIIRIKPLGDFDKDITYGEE